jgi:hypothetical protein
MATALRNLTRMGTDVKQIARLLQKKAPPGHMLAYISPEEAEVLKNRGGSGRITEAGIPSFELDDNLILQGPGPQPVTEAPTPTSREYGGDSYAPLTTLPSYDIQSSPVSNVQAGAPEQTFVPDFSFSTPKTTQVTPAYSGGAAALTPQELALSQTQGPPGEASYTPPTGQTAFQQLPDTEKPAAKGLSGDTLARLGIAGIGTLLGAKSARDAAAQGQAAKQALQAQAAPYQQQGQALLAATQRGELTPANQQILQAQQAQAAQNVATRGGVGGMQAQNQINALSQQLLQSQLNLGLQLQSVGDKIAQGAIQAGVQADQYVNNLTSSYAMNIARTLVGGAPGEPTPTVPRG